MKCFCQHLFLHNSYQDLVHKSDQKCFMDRHAADSRQQQVRLNGEITEKWLGNSIWVQRARVA